jgi:hypothetical protein
MIVGGIFIKDIKGFGWQALGLTAALNLVIFLLGDFISGKWRLLRVLGGVAIAVLIALIGGGVLYVTELLGKPISQSGNGLAAATVTVLLLFLSTVEVRRYIRSFVAAPDVAINYRALWWLTGITVFLAGVLILLARFGQAGIGAFEFARYLPKAELLLSPPGAAISFRRQLLVDYFFLVSYAATFAAYCGAAARLFWQRHAIIAEKARKKHAEESRKSAESSGATGTASTPIRWKPSRFLRTLRWIALAGFALAAAQLLAGLADAVENTGLLWFLENRTPPLAANALAIAFYSAALKFALIALGTLYSAAGFAVGFWQNRKQISLLLFAAISVLTTYVCAAALFRHVF